MHDFDDTKKTFDCVPEPESKPVTKAWVNREASSISRRAIASSERIEVKTRPEDYLVVYRDDFSGSLRSLTDTLQALGAPEEEVRSLVAEQAFQFTTALSHSMNDGYTHHCGEDGVVCFEILSAEQLRANLRESSAGAFVVSLDNLIELDAPELQISHIWTLDGLNRYTVPSEQSPLDQILGSEGAIERPGTGPVASQLEVLMNRYKEAGSPNEIILQDDVLFSGTTLVSVTKLLTESGLKPTRAIPTIGVGESSKLADHGVDVDPIIRYKAPGSESIFQSVNMYGVADYLLGGTGLVVKLPSGASGRAPYLKPFLAPEGQAQIHPDFVDDFSRKMLQANRAFYSTLQSKLGVELTVAQLEPGFAALVTEVHGVSPTTSVLELIDWAERNMIDAWETTSKLSARQRELFHF